jgi:hypothetical protein
MVKNEQTIKAEIKDFMSKWGGAYSGWYAGITEDPKRRLREHSVIDEYNYSRYTKDWL